MFVFTILYAPIIRLCRLLLIILFFFFLPDCLLLLLGGGGWLLLLLFFFCFVFGRGGGGEGGGLFVFPAIGHGMVADGLVLSGSIVIGFPMQLGSGVNRIWPVVGFPMCYLMLRLSL